MVDTLLRALRWIVAVSLLIALTGCRGDDSSATATTDTYQSAHTATATACLPGLPGSNACTPATTSASYQRLPDPNSAGVSGGGPLTNDAQAAARIRSFLPTASASFYSLDDSEAISYASVVAQLVPDVATEFDSFQTVSNCAINNGVIAARAYIAKDLSVAGAMIILSRGQLRQLPQIAIKCFATSITGGGPSSSQFSPCFRRLYFDASIAGVVDRYYTFVVATSTSVCQNLADALDRYGPQDFQP